MNRLYGPAVPPAFARRMAEAYGPVEGARLAEAIGA